MGKLAMPCPSAILMTNTKTLEEKARSSHEQSIPNIKHATSVMPDLIRHPDI
jgi:hypothetical protein